MSDDLIIAVISGLALVCAAGIPTLVTLAQSRKLHASQSDIQDRIGTPNGTGNLVEQNDSQLWVLAEMKAAQAQHAADDDRRFSEIYERFDIPPMEATS